MQTVGELAKVHINGRICYDGELTAADGRTREEMTAEAVRVARRVQRRAERRLADAEEAAAALDARGGTDGAGSREAREAAERAEEDLEVAMDNAIRAKDRWRKSCRDAAKRERRDAASEAMAGDAAAATPPNFSRLGALELDADGKLPRALDGAHLLECDIQAGSMLYLPAGWFHEVRSAGGLHCALNYWFHPPDSTEYERPYRAAAFWRREWRRVRRREQRALQEEG